MIFENRTKVRMAHFNISVAVNAANMTSEDSITLLFQAEYDDLLRTHSQLSFTCSWKL